VAGLFLLGLALCIFPGPDTHFLRWLVLGVTVGISAIPPVNRALIRALELVRNPSPRGLERGGLIIGVAATCYLVATAFAQDRALFPRTEDDCSYVLGAQMLAHGRLWLPAHPMADFFESFYVLVKPVYCSIYFPGAALFFAPMGWFHWPSWAIPALLSGVSVAMVYRIATHLLDGTAGILAGVWLVSLRWFRMLSMVSMSHVPMLLLGLLMFWFFLRWRSAAGRRRMGWAVALGAASGWAAVTRPADALAFAIPIGLGVLLELVKSPGRTRLLATTAIIAGAAPFLVLQLVFNAGVSGSVLRTPYTLYLRENQPGSEIGISTFDASLKPRTTLPEKLAFYDWCKYFLRGHQPANFLYPWLHAHPAHDGIVPPHLLLFADAAVPSRLLLVLLPLGLPGLTTRGRILFVTILPLFLAAYVLNPFFVEHYAVVVAPVVILLALLGARKLATLFPRAASADAVIGVAVLTLSLTSFWEIYRFMPSPGSPAGDDLAESPLMAYVNVELPTKVHAPAVVLFRQSASRIYFFVEPVYNLDAPDIDSNPIIRAHDLGPARDAGLVNYYAQRQPQREFYLFDRDTGSLTPLGTAESLDAHFRSGANPASVIQPRL
jgi:hypothetical protein